MRTLILIAALIIFMPPCKTFAQTDDYTEHKKMQAIICRDFGVKEKEADVIITAIQYNRLKMLEVVTSKTLTRANKAARMQVLLTERQAKIKQLLTPAQQERLKYLEAQPKNPAANTAVAPAQPGPQQH